jgi:hypothetical protein
MAAFRIPVWSGLTRLQRILLGAIVVIVALFIVSAATSGRAGDGGPDSGRSGIVAWLGDLLGGSSTVDRKDLSADCLQPDGRLVINGSCVLRVARSDSDVRQVKLRARDALSVRAPAPRGDQVVTDDLDAGKDVAIAVNGDGADITLTCAGADTCVATLI